MSNEYKVSLRHHQAFFDPIIKQGCNPRCPLKFDLNLPCKSYFLSTFLHTPTLLEYTALFSLVIAQFKDLTKSSCIHALHQQFIIPI